MKFVEKKSTHFFKNNRPDMALIAKRLEDNSLGKMGIVKDSGKIGHLSKSTRDNELTRLQRINTEQFEAGSPYPTPVSSNKLPQHGDGANALSQTDESIIAGSPLKTADDENVIDLVPNENRVNNVVFNGTTPELTKIASEIGRGEIKSAGAKKLMAIAENSANEVAGAAEQIISANIAKINDSSIEFYANNINILNEVAKKYPMLSKSEQIELANKRILQNASPELLAYTKAINGGELPSDPRMLGTNASRMVAKSLEVGATPAEVRDMLLKANIKADLAAALAKQLKSRDISAFNDSLRASEQRLLNESVQSVRSAARNESIGQILDSAKAKAIENDKLATSGYHPSDRLYQPTKADIKEAKKEVRNLQKEHEQNKASDSLFGEDSELKAELSAKQERLRDLKAKEKANRTPRPTEQERINTLSLDELNERARFIANEIPAIEKLIRQIHSRADYPSKELIAQMELLHRERNKLIAEQPRIKQAMDEKLFNMKKAQKTSDEMPKNSIDELETGIEKISNEISKRSEQWVSELSQKTEQAQGEIYELMAQRNQLSGSQKAKLTKIINQKQKALNEANERAEKEFYNSKEMASLFETRKALEKELRELKNSGNSRVYNLELDLSPSGLKANSGDKPPLANKGHKSVATNPEAAPLKDSTASTQQLEAAESSLSPKPSANLDSLSRANAKNFTPNEIKSQGGGGFKKGFSTQAINQAMLNVGSGVAGGNIAMANEDDPNKKAQAFIMGFLAGFGGSAGAMKLLSKNATKLAPQLARASEKMAQEFPNLMDKHPYILGGVLGKINNAKDNFKNIFGGEKALGANKAKLEVAKELTQKGMDESEVWAKTGWYKDIDNKWKFEINPKGGELKELKGIQKLGEVLDDKELFKAYAELEDLPILTTNIKKDGVKAYFMRTNSKGIEDNAIFFDYEYLQTASKDDIRSTLYHELQHAVQKIEGFASGADSKAAGFENYFKSAGEAESRNVETRLGSSAKEREYIVNNPQRKELITQIKEVTAKNSNLDQIMSDYKAGKITAEQRNELIKQNSENIQKATAQLVAKREMLDKKLAEEYLAKTHPYETMDIAPNERIVRFDSDVSASYTPKQKEVRGVYNVAFNEKRATQIYKDIEDVENAIKFEKGKADYYKNNKLHDGFGSLHIKKHLDPKNEGYITTQEYLNMGEYIRKAGDFKESGGKRVYDYTDENGVRFRAIIGDTRGGKDRVISFFSDRNGEGLSMTPKDYNSNLANAKNFSANEIKSQELEMRDSFSPELTNAKSVLSDESKELLKQKAKAKNGDFSGADDAKARLMLDKHRANADNIAKEKGVNSKEYKEAKAFADDFEQLWFEKDGSPKLAPSPCRG